MPGLSNDDFPRCINLSSVVMLLFRRGVAMARKQVLEGELNSDTFANDYYTEWLTLDDKNMVGLIEDGFFLKRVRITIEEVEEAKVEMS